MSVVDRAAERAAGTALELGEFPVVDVVAGNRTAYEDGVLSIDVEELRALVLEDPRIGEVDVDIAHPGESARIHNIVDTVEPRVRVGEPGSDFPGMLSPARVGRNGRTHRLSGVTVTQTSEPVEGEQTYWRTAIVDLQGETAAFSPFGALHHVALSLRPDLSRWPAGDDGAELNVMLGRPQAMEYLRAVRKAGLRVATYLARTVQEQEPPSLRTYARAPVDGDLPRVVYVMQAYAVNAYGAPTELPGSSSAGALPTFVEPSEILDGALVNLQTWPACHRDVTYLFQNHPVVDELYRRHGVDLEFGGVVLYTRGGTPEAKERMSSYCAAVARSLGADGAILTYVGSGHSLVDVMLACRELERSGIDTVVLLPEMDAGSDGSGLVYFVPEADAIVSTGNYETDVSFPEVERAIGGETLFETGESARGPFHLPLRALLASTDPFGSWTISGRER